MSDNIVQRVRLFETAVQGRHTAGNNLDPVTFYTQFGPSTEDPYSQNLHIRASVRRESEAVSTTIKVDMTFITLDSLLEVAATLVRELTSIIRTKEEAKKLLFHF